MPRSLSLFFFRRVTASFLFLSLTLSLSSRLRKDTSAAIAFTILSRWSFVTASLVTASFVTNGHSFLLLPGCLELLSLLFFRPRAMSCRYVRLWPRGSVVADVKGVVDVGQRKESCGPQHNQSQIQSRLSHKIWFRCKGKMTTTVDTRFYCLRSLAPRSGHHDRSDHCQCTLASIASAHSPLALGITVFSLLLPPLTRPSLWASRCSRAFIPFIESRGVVASLKNVSPTTATTAVGITQHHYG